MSDIGNPWDAMGRAVREARDIQNAVARSANSMALLLRGNLKHVDKYTLQELKRELQKFDACTKKWKP